MKVLPQRVRKMTMSRQQCNHGFAGVELACAALRSASVHCDHQVCDEDAECAALLCVACYLVYHARRIFSGADTEAIDAQWIADQIESGALGSSFTVREFQHRNRMVSVRPVLARVSASAYFF